MILKDKKTQVILENATHEGDTGSPEVQIAILTARINELTDHLRGGGRCADRSCFEGNRPGNFRYAVGKSLKKLKISLYFWENS